MIAIAEALKTNTTLQNLDLSGNHLTDVGVIAIADALKTNTHLQNLDIYEDGITAEILKNILYRIRYNSLIKKWREIVKKWREKTESAMQKDDAKVVEEAKEVVEEVKKINFGESQESMYTNLHTEATSLLDDTVKNPIFNPKERMLLKSCTQPVTRNRAIADPLNAKKFLPKKRRSVNIRRVKSPVGKKKSKRRFIS